MISFSMGINFKPLWFDSMGAKSTSMLVETPDVCIIIDPGCAIIHSSFPGDNTLKNKWLENATKIIKKACEKADILTVSHYHHDHYFYDDIELYKAKMVFAKNPNEYINDMQRVRAEVFIKQIINKLKILKNDLSEYEYLKDYIDPLDEIPIARDKDFGGYQRRREELLAKGLIQFKKRVINWKKYKPLPEIKSDKIELCFPEEKTYEFGDTNISFTKPLFHGIEYASVGWVFGTIIEHEGEKLIHSSDLCGPIIEDYAKWIIDEKPNYLFIDGPTTYLLGYILNNINLKRTIDNMVNIIKNSNTEVILFDHHITREKKFKVHTKTIWDRADELGINLYTIAEYLGKRNVVEMDYNES